MIANQLPTLGYLTLLDLYILGVFGIIVLVIGELALVEWLDVEHEYQRYILYGDVGLWAFSNLFFALYARRAVGGTERMKSRQLQSTASMSRLNGRGSNGATVDNPAFGSNVDTLF